MFDIQEPGSAPGSTIPVPDTWSHGGRTSLENLIGLCKYHHTLVHDRGYLIAAGPAGTFTLLRPDGTGIPPSPALPQPEGTIEDCHDADITPETIVPSWYGERLNLDDAIYACLANARTPQEPSQQVLVKPGLGLDEGRGLDSGQRAGSVAGHA